MYVLLAVQLKVFTKEEFQVMKTSQLLAKLRDSELSLNQVFQKFAHMTLGIELEDLIAYLLHCAEHVEFTPIYVLPRTNCTQDTTYDELLSTHVYNGHILEDALAKLTELH